MFSKIKDWIKEKVNLLANAVVEVKLWVVALVEVMFAWTAVKTAFYILTKAPKVVAAFASVYAVGLVVSLLVLAIILAFRGIEIRVESRPNWRVVS